MSITSSRHLAAAVAVGLVVLSTAAAPGIAIARDQSLGADPNGRSSGIDPLGRDAGLLIDPNGRLGHGHDWNRDGGPQMDRSGGDWLGDFLRRLFGWL